MEPTRCEGCGLELEGGTIGCQVLFEQACAANHERPGPTRSHRVFVDAYSLQHPQRYCESAKSLFAHMGGLLVEFECDGDPAVLEAQRKSLDGRVRLPRPDPPAVRGKLTVREVLAAAEGPPRQKVIQAYAKEQWEAYGPLQSLAAQWTRMALRHR
jgi:hypothetical protein